MKKDRVRILFVCLIAALAVACSNAEAKKKRFVEQADQALAKKQFKEAILGYRNAIKIDPRFGEARYKLAQAYVGDGDTVNAAREYVRAAELLPANLEANLKATQYLLAAREFDRARTRAQQILVIDPKHVEGHILLGSAIAGMKDYVGGLREIEEAIKLAPESGAGYTNRAALLLAQGKKTEAEENFRKAVEIDPKTVAPRLALASYLWSVGSLPEAERTIRGALDVEPENGVANRALAILLMGTGRAKEAEPHVKATVKAAGVPEAEIMLADYYLQVGRSAEAKAILERLTANDKTAAGAGVTLGMMEYASGDRTAAYKRIDAVLTKFPSNVPALTAKARWLLGEQHAKEALAPAEAAVKADPASASAHFVLGSVKASLGKSDEAKAEFTEVLKINPRAGIAQTALASLNLATGSTEAGVQFARDALASQPSNASARLLLVRGLIMRNEIDRARAELSIVQASLPNNPGVIALNGALLLLKGDQAAARREYERALSLDPKQLDALTGLAVIDARSGQLARSRERISAQLSGSPTNTGLLMLAARTDLQAGDRTAAEQHLRRVIELDPANLKAFELLGRVYIEERKLDEAQRQFEAMLTINPRSVGIQTIVGMLLHSQSKLDDAAKAYEKALQIDPSAPVAANNLANIYADRDQNLDEALKLAKTAADRLPEEPAIADTVGWIYYKKQLPTLAVPEFERSVQKEPSNPVFHYHLGLAYARSGDAQKARRSLEEALRLSSSFDGAADARQVLASLKG